MAVNRSSDSLTSCDKSQYDNIYDVRKRGDVKHEPSAATRLIHKDTIEISKDKLKEDALKRLRHTTSVVIAQPGFMRVGKFLFLSVALPPYFALYGLPKWLLVEGLPALMNLALWCWNKIQTQVKKKVETGSQKVAQISRYVQRLSKILMQPFVHLALQIRQTIQRFKENIAQKCRHLMASALQLLSRPLERGKEKLLPIRKKLRSIKDRTSERIDKAQEALQQGVQWIKDRPQVLLSWGQLQFQKWTHQVISLSFRWRGRLHASQQFADKSTNWVARQLQRGTRGIIRPFSPLLNFYRRQLLPQWKNFKNHYQRKWNQTKQSFQNRHGRGLAYLQNKQIRVKQLTIDKFLSWILSHAWMKKLPQAWLKKWFSHPVVRLVCKIGLNCYSFLAKILLEVSIYTMKGIVKGSEWIGKGFYFLQKGVEIGKSYLLTVLNQVFFFLQKVGLYLLYYTLLILTISVIFLIWMLRYLVNYGNDLVASLSFREAVISKSSPSDQKSLFLFSPLKK